MLSQPFCLQGLFVSQCLWVVIPWRPERTDALSHSTLGCVVNPWHQTYAPGTGWALQSEGYSAESLLSEAFQTDVEGQGCSSLQQTVLGDTAKHPQRGGESKLHVKDSYKASAGEVFQLKKHKIKILPWTISLLFKGESSPEEAKFFCWKT